MRHLYRYIIIGLFLTACAGPDYTPVYFGSSDNGGPTIPPKKVTPSESVHCNIELTAKLCVTIKGDNIAVGTDSKELMCSDAPPIPFEIQGDQVLLKGSNFPDIPVTVDIKGVETPMMINGKGETDGSDNVAIGTWTPEGELSAKNFSLYVTVLGLTGKIEGIDLTTDITKETPHLPSIKGKKIGVDGKGKLVATTVLGHVIDAADKFLMGASMQVALEGTFDPPLTECISSNGDESLKIVAIEIDENGNVIEIDSGEEQVLVVSEGTYIAESESDIGKMYEGSRDFKLANEGTEDLKIKLPQQSGPFFIGSKGQTEFILEPGETFLFTIIFKPTLDTAPEPGEIKQSIRIGRSLFQLKGTALQHSGEVGWNKISDQGMPSKEEETGIIFTPLSLPAGTQKAFFRCHKKECGGVDALTSCESCTPPNIQGCQLYPINTNRKPVDAVDESCHPLDANTIPMMGIDLTGSDITTVSPSKQTLQIQNNGVRDLKIASIVIEEVQGSKSKGEFQWNPDSILVGPDLQRAKKTVFPITLPPYHAGFDEMKIFITVTYFPNDLLGSDGMQAATGLSITDRAQLIIVSENKRQTIPLEGATKIEEVPALLAYFATETGLKPKDNGETFFFEKLTEQVRDYSVPVYLKLSDTATEGVRVEKMVVQGKDKEHFEWLIDQEKVKERIPPPGQGKRCSIPVYDSATGRQMDESFDLPFVANDGFALKPAAYSLSNMPLFGCLNFHRGEDPSVKRIFEAELLVQTAALDHQGKPKKNPDGSLQKSELIVPIKAVLDPLKGKFVLRVAQTLFAILNPTTSVISAMPHRQETIAMMKDGHGSQKELNVMLGSVVLDPFLEMEKTDHLRTPIGRNSSVVFRPVDTRPTSEDYTEETLDDFITLLHDSLLPKGTGIFYDYGTEEKPLPKPLRTNSWRIFTGALSYPGPFEPSPIDIDQCEPIDPCDRDQLKKFTKSGASANNIGACAFFFASGGHIDSPAFLKARNGEDDLCTHREEPQDLLSVADGEYRVDGKFTVADLGLRFWGPNYFLNPYGPLGDVPPMDDVFHIAFTTEVLRPQKEGEPYNLIPDAKIDLNKQEFKINLSDENHINPVMCPSNRNNRTLLGKKYSSWRYLAPLLFKDEEGTIPAGCPEDGSNFTGGTAYLKGRRIDPETGIATLVAIGKFSARDELSLAFKNIPILIALNVWLCDPQGDEANFEGAKCFDETFNDRDEKAQITFMDE